MWVCLLLSVSFVSERSVAVYMPVCVSHMHISLIVVVVVVVVAVVIDVCMLPPAECQESTNKATGWRCVLHRTSVLMSGKSFWFLVQSKLCVCCLCLHI